MSRNVAARLERGRNGHGRDYLLTCQQLYPDLQLVVGAEEQYPSEIVWLICGAEKYRILFITS